MFSKLYKNIVLINPKSILLLLIITLISFGYFSKEFKLYGLRNKLNITLLFSPIFSIISDIFLGIQSSRIVAPVAAGAMVLMKCMLWLNPDAIRLFRMPKPTSED